MSFLGTLLDRGYRAFFMLAGLFAIIAMTVWAFWIALGAAFALPPHWHAHEMIFGYATAAIAGFFLTAVPSWTGAPAARRAFIATGVCIWLAGRLAVGYSDSLNPVLTAVIDLAFLPVLSVKVIGQLARRPKPQNLMLVGLLGLVWSGNLVFHLGVGGLAGADPQSGLRVGLLGITSIIAVIGGRVVPAFTRNALVRSGRETRLPSSRRPFEIAGIAFPILLTVLHLVPVSGILIGIVASVAGLAQLLRLAGWRSMATIREPILWSLHLAFGMLALGYVALGLSQFQLLSELMALHILGIGAIGGMTLAVMSRAILGHSGQPLVAAPATAAAYLLVAGAAVLRFAADVVPGHVRLPLLLASAGLWVLGFALFVWEYWSVVTERDRRNANAR